MKLSKADIDERMAYIEYLDGIGASCILSSIEDYETFELFRYAAQRAALESRGIDVDRFPIAAKTKKSDVRSMTNLFESYFTEERVSPETLFAECNDVRDKIARLTGLTEGQLLIVCDDMSVEFTVRRYAEAILSGTIDDLHNILNQSLGKPLERKISLTRTDNALSGLTTDEIRALLDGQDSIIDVEDISEKGEEYGNV